MKVKELRELLTYLDDEVVVTVLDPHLHVECHARSVDGPWALLIESTGRIVTEEHVQ